MADIKVWFRGELRVVLSIAIKEGTWKVSTLTTSLKVSEILPIFLSKLKLIRFGGVLSVIYRVTIKLL